MTTTFLKDIETVARNGGAKAPWLEALRRQGAERFAATGFPTSRDEDWRFNTLAPLTQAEFQLEIGRAHV